MPMVTLTKKGRRSGRPHAVHLACVEHDGAQYVVASAMGQARHPAWLHNLVANPEVEVQAHGKRFRARAEVLPDDRKEALWPAVKRAIPQLEVYEARTDRNIRLVRLVRKEGNDR